MKVHILLGNNFWASTLLFQVNSIYDSFAQSGRQGRGMVFQEHYQRDSNLILTPVDHTLKEKLLKRKYLPQSKINVNVNLYPPGFHAEVW